MSDSPRQLLVGWLRSPLIRIILGALVSLLTLYLAFRNIDLGDVRDALLQADLRYIALALLSVGVNTLAKAVRWGVFLRPAGQRVGFSKLLMALLMGQALNTLLPARVGDLSRAHVVGVSGPGRVFTLGTIVLEKLFDLVAYACLFVILLLLIPLPGWVSSSGYLLAWVTLALTLVTFLVTYQRERFIRVLERLSGFLPAGLRSYLVPRLRSAFASLQVLKDPLDLLKLAWWTAFVWGTALLNNQFVLLAFDLHLPLTASLLILVGLTAGISIPAVPGKIGVFEYICVLALSLFQVDQAQALSYGIALHAVVFLPTTLLGLLFTGVLGARVGISPRADSSGEAERLRAG